MAQKRPFRFYLIVLGLALLSLALLRVQAQTAPDTLPEHEGAACVTICPLPGEGHPSPPDSVQPATSHSAAHNFPSLHPRSELPAPTLLANRYVPVTLHRVD
ncbi:MAG: hypothetical protein JXA14_14815 [Anaerolineae bacterium]|nr:hypothetical protein [Anaerolineae bacterium]